MEWKTYLLALIVLMALVGGMAIGVILSNRRIKGSCAGIRDIMGEDANGCEICEMKEKCEVRANDCHDESQAKLQAGV